VILLESLGANKTGLFGNPLQPTPRIDAIGRESLQFRRFFVASRGTARAIFSLLTGIPDVTRRASRNPLIVDQHLILEDLEAHEKLYFYTGDLAFGNLRGLIQNNLSSVRIFEEKDYTSPHNDGWGISDLHLFEEANKVFRRTQRPFFAILQTSGNHRPYTIPDDRRGFELAAPQDPHRLVAAGLRSDDEYNALRFMDHSVGWFLETAKGEPYFDRTIFVLLGDHGSRGSGASPLQKIGLTAIHVPLLIYAPAMLEPRVVEDVTSSLDVMPTLARLLGTPYVNSTLGRDALEPRAPEHSYAFSDAGLVDGEFFYAAGRLFRYSSETPDHDVSARFPDRLADMRRRWEDMRETAVYLMHHNQKAAAADACGSPRVASAR
jgi:arylsulfatase A-like enzyme